MKKISSLLAAVSVFAFSASADATTVVYTISGTGSGSLAGQAFNAAAFTFTLTGDTANVTGTPGTLQINNPLTSAAFSIAGLGSGLFNFSTRFGQAGNVAFFSRSSGMDLFDFTGSTVNLASSFGPIAGLNVFALEQFQGVGTNVGALSFNTASNVTYSSRVGTPAAAVPEPATWAMMLVGFAAIGFGMRRKQLHTVNYNFA